MSSYDANELAESNYDDNGEVFCNSSVFPNVKLYSCADDKTILKMAWVCKVDIYFLVNFQMIFPLLCHREIDKLSANVYFWMRGSINVRCANSFSCNEVNVYCVLPGYCI